MPRSLHVHRWLVPAWGAAPSAHHPEPRRKALPVMQSPGVFDQNSWVARAPELLELPRWWSDGHGDQRPGSPSAQAPPSCPWTFCPASLFQELCSLTSLPTRGLQPEMVLAPLFTCCYRVFGFSGDGKPLVSLALDLEVAIPRDSARFSALSSSLFQGISQDCISRIQGSRVAQHKGLQSHPGPRGLGLPPPSSPRLHALSPEPRVHAHSACTKSSVGSATLSSP